MKAIVIDDEPWMLRHFSDECASLSEIELVGSFRNPLTALEFAQNNKIEGVRTKSWTTQALDFVYTPMGYAHQETP